MVYQMARTTDELDHVDQNELVSTSDSQTGFLPEAERFSLKTILSPRNMEPSKFSGLIVNISTSLIGKSLPFPVRCLGSCSLALYGFLSLVVEASAGKDKPVSCCWTAMVVDGCRSTASLSIGFGEN